MSRQPEQADEQQQQDGHPAVAREEVDERADDGAVDEDQRLARPVGHGPETRGEGGDLAFELGRARGGAALRLGDQQGRQRCRPGRAPPSSGRRPSRRRTRRRRARRRPRRGRRCDSRAGRSRRSRPAGSHRSPRCGKASRAMSCVAEEKATTSANTTIHHRSVRGSQNAMASRPPAMPALRQQHPGAAPAQPAR